MYEIDYDLLAKQTLSLCEGGDGSAAFETACLANVSALLFDALADVNWAGFYRLMPDGSLLLGPFQGKPACMVLAAGKGVCQAAVASGRSVVVNDVHAFPGHIACDSASASEIVVPLRRSDGILWGVLDIDSPVKGRFGEIDRTGLEKIGKASETVL
jgi:GAF domain-containing protein